MYTYFFGGCGRLMVADANLFTRNDSVGLTKERSDPEFMIDCHAGDRKAWTLT